MENSIKKLFFIITCSLINALHSVCFQIYWHSVIVAGSHTFAIHSLGTWVKHFLSHPPVFTGLICEFSIFLSFNFVDVLMGVYMRSIWMRVNSKYLLNWFSVAELFKDCGFGLEGTNENWRFRLFRLTTKMTEKIISEN